MQSTTTTCKDTLASLPTTAELRRRIATLEDDSVYSALARRRGRLGTERVSLEEVQVMLDEALGTRPIKELLDEVRRND